LKVKTPVQNQKPTKQLFFRYYVTLKRGQKKAKNNVTYYFEWPLIKQSEEHEILLKTVENISRNSNILVNFNIGDEMPRHTYLYENRMFTNKMRLSIILGRKGKALAASEEKSICAN